PKSFRPGRPPPRPWRMRSTSSSSLRLTTETAPAGPLLPRRALFPKGFAFRRRNFVQADPPPRRRRIGWPSPPPKGQPPKRHPPDLLPRRVLLFSASASGEATALPLQRRHRGTISAR